MLYIIVDAFLKDSCIYKPWVSKLHPAGASSPTKLAYQIFSNKGLPEKNVVVFFSREVVGQNFCEMVLMFSQKGAGICEMF